MRKYFEISGYWKDDNEEFEGYIVTNYDDHEEDGKYDEDDIFFYGFSEAELKEAVSLGENTAHEFVITEYKTI